MEATGDAVGVIAGDGKNLLVFVAERKSRVSTAIVELERRIWEG